VFLSWAAAPIFEPMVDAGEVIMATLDEHDGKAHLVAHVQGSAGSCILRSLRNHAVERAPG
jgi:hypothetical protein